LEAYGLNKFDYSMLIARMEPENNIEMILDGKVASGTNDLFLVIGKYDNKFGQKMYHKFNGKNGIKFLGAIYDINLLNSLRYFCKLYFHGHSVGGTNPSLLEAMGSGALICAHNNPFNAAILGDDGLYFSNSLDVSKIILNSNRQNEEYSSFVKNNFAKVSKIYNWNKINNEYEEYLLYCLRN
jgi:glycosyltransferase involved in cell wall biosynthesis